MPMPILIEIVPPQGRGTATRLYAEVERAGDTLIACRVTGFATADAGGKPAWIYDPFRDAPPAGMTLGATGSAFQNAVWAALRAIPAGETRSYSDIAAAIGRPTAVRAVANACAANPIALWIPCHRVCRRDGGLGGYRWGVAIKEVLLANEGVRQPRHADAARAFARDTALPLPGSRAGAR